MPQNKQNNHKLLLTILDELKNVKVETENIKNDLNEIRKSIEPKKVESENESKEETSSWFFG
jgi:hypothetical protein